VSTTGTLEGRRALVTGGNRGIGLIVCRMLADLGAGVVLGAREVGSGERAASTLRPRSVEVARINVADHASVREAADRLGPAGVDVLVNNAAINPRGNLDADEIERAWQTNLLGAWRTIQAFLPPMRERGWGRIVNVSTELATRAHEQRGGGVYAATKIALNAMTRALAEDLAGSGILVNACSPGWCRTDMGGEGAPRSAEQGAASIAWGVTLPNDGPSGGFFQDGEPLPF
jgi:NAD(P)-dependent dehydrogenase (short-subunit alcohol dehydrogenase family)